MVMIICTLAACGTENETSDTSGYTIDYNDATSFETLMMGQQLKVKSFSFM